LNDGWHCSDDAVRPGLHACARMLNLPRSTPGIGLKK
jgi:hypothetical protein